MRTIIEHLARAISSEQKPLLAFDSWNLATGTAGLAFFYEAIASTVSGPWQSHAERALVQTFALQVAETFPSCDGGLFTGLAGVCQVISFFAQTHADYGPLKQQFDYLLCSWVQNLCQHHPLEQLTDGVSFRDYDVISGPAGIASYLLSLMITSPSSEAATALDMLLERLIFLSQPSDSIPGHLRLFIPSHRAPYQTYAQRYPQGATDCGFAHGLPGVLALLSLCHSRHIEHNGLSQAIHQLARWLIDHRDETAHQFRWPSIVPLGAPTVLGDVVWCYGASGVAWALWLAGLAVQEQAWQELGIRTMETIYHELVVKEERLSPMLCHGLAGILLVVHGFALQTNDAPFFVHFQQFLLKKLLGRFDPSLPLGVWERVQTHTPLTNCAFLEGVAGIGLTFLSAEYFDQRRLLFPYFLLTAL